MRLFRGAEEGEGKGGQGDRSPRTSVGELKLPAAERLECYFSLRLFLLSDPLENPSRTRQNLPPPPPPPPVSQRGGPAGSWLCKQEEELLRIKFSLPRPELRRVAGSARRGTEPVLRGWRAAGGRPRWLDVSRWMARCAEKRI